MSIMIDVEVHAELQKSFGIPQPGKIRVEEGLVVEQLLRNLGVDTDKTWVTVVVNDCIAFPHSKITDGDKVLILPVPELG